MTLENELEQKEIFRVYGMDMKENTGTSLKRGRSKTESFIINFKNGYYMVLLKAHNDHQSIVPTIESAEIKEKPRKKKKLNPSTNPVNEISEKSQK